MSLWKSSPSCVTQRRGLYPNVAGCSSGSPSAGWLFAWPKSQPVNLTYLTSAYEETAKFEINQFVQLWFNCNHIDMPLFSSNLFSVCIVLCLQLILALTAITIFLCSFVQNNNNNKKIPPREERNNESVFTNSQKNPSKTIQDVANLTMASCPCSVLPAQLHCRFCDTQPCKFPLTVLQRKKLPLAPVCSSALIPRRLYKTAFKC